MVSANSHHGQPSEYVSEIALELLDEVHIRMMECRLVLKALTDEADLNFAELDRDLHAAQQSARRAYEAGSVVHQGARLDARPGSDWSRPNEIFARHEAAVRAGAARVDPTSAMGDCLERSLWQLPTSGSVDHVGRQRDAGGQLSVQWVLDRDSRREWIDEISSTIPGEQ